MIRQRGNAKVERGKGSATLVTPVALCAVRPAAFVFPQPPVPKPQSPRHGVTLIELLITMAIMAIISAAILGTASAAMENARRNRTQVLVTKIHGLILEKLASYESQRRDLNPTIQAAINGIVTTAATGSPADFAAANLVRGAIMADARLLAVREQMKLEMPDRWEDLDYYSGRTQPLVLSGFPSLARNYRRRYTAAQAASNDSAECLYMTVMNATGDGEARTLFAKQDIGDTDEDGAPEFIDGWGQPISWIRWPAGAISDLQPLLPASPSQPEPMRADHDSFDRYRRDLLTVTTPPINLYPTAGTTNFHGTYKDNIRDRLTSTAPLRQKSAFRLVPLIYSAGPDGNSAMVRPDDPSVAPLDPYINFEHRLTGGGTIICQDGEIDPNNASEAKDNISNHLIEY